MSDYGLIVKNNSSEIQIDSLYKNFTLKDSGSLVIAPGTTTLNFTDVTSVPLIAIRPTTVSFCALLGLNKSGSTYISAAVGGEIDPSGGTIQWAMFINALSQSLPAYGLIVKNPSDEVVFSSNETYFKIVDIHSFSLSLNYTPGTYIDITVNDADNNYFILYPFSYGLNYEIEEEDPPTYRTLMHPMGMKKISSTVIRINEFLLWEQSGEEEDTTLWYTNCKLIEIGT